MAGTLGLLANSTVYSAKPSILETPYSYLLCSGKYLNIQNVISDVPQLSFDRTDVSAVYTYNYAGVTQTTMGSGFSLLGAVQSNSGVSLSLLGAAELKHHGRDIFSHWLFTGSAFSAGSVVDWFLLDEAVSGKSLASFLNAWNEFVFKIDNTTSTSNMAVKNRLFSWKDYLIVEISEYGRRPEGWDGYDARSIIPSAINDAQDFIQLLPDYIDPPQDQPCPDGEVSLVWRNGRHFAEVGFPGDGTFYWYATNGEVHGGDDNVPIRRGLPWHLREIMDMRRVHQGQIETSLPPLAYPKPLMAPAA